MASIELGSYFLIFTFCQLYSLYRFYQATQDSIGRILLESDYDFTVHCATPWAQWTCNQPRDISDPEWQVAKHFYLHWKVLLFAGHSLGFFLTRKYFPKILRPFVIAYTCACVLLLLGPHPAGIILLNIVISTFLLPRLTWLVPAPIPKQIVHYLFFACSVYANNMYHADVYDFEVNLLVNMSISWLNARCLSAAIDSELEHCHTYGYGTRIAYLLYFPSFFFGPISHYSDFCRSLSILQDPYEANFSISPLSKRLFSLARFFFWAFALEYVLKHYLYSSAYLNYPHLLNSLDPWPVAGFGFCLMLLFFVKYFVLYGTTKALAELDGLSGVFAPPPQCIAHMNKTSYLWRKFDQGLYAFLVKYFYKPLTGSHYQSALRRMAGSAVCFAMIAVWHEQMESYSVLVWVAVNFTLLNLELAGGLARKYGWFDRIEQSTSSQTWTRIEALIGSPYLSLAYLSNILFLSNLECAQILIRKLFLASSLIPALTTMGALYAGCHVCKYINGRLSQNQDGKT